MKISDLPMKDGDVPSFFVTRGYVPFYFPLDPNYIPINPRWRYFHLHLVGGIPTTLKNMSSSVGMMKFPTEWKVIKFHGSKPPTSIYIICN